MLSWWIGSNSHPGLHKFPPGRPINVPKALSQECWDWVAAPADVTLVQLTYWAVHTWSSQQHLRNNYLHIYQFWMDIFLGKYKDWDSGWHKPSIWGTDVAGELVASIRVVLRLLPSSHPIVNPSIPDKAHSPWLFKCWSSPSFAGTIHIVQDPSAERLCHCASVRPSSHPWWKFWSSIWERAFYKLKFPV